MNLFNNRTPELQNKIIDLEAKLKEKDAVIEKMHGLLNAHNTLIEFFDEHKTDNETERKKYVSDVTMSYVTVFKKQFPQFIFDQQQFLSMFGRSEKEYDIIRCNINVIRLFEEWMIRMTNEHLGDLEESRNKVEETEDFTNNLRETYNIPNEN